MKVASLVSLLVSVIILEQAVASSVPTWVRRQMRKGRRRIDDVPNNCNNYVFSRCQQGTCFLKEENYPDTEDGFTNALFGEEFFCLCDAGYETYYPKNEKGKEDEPTGTNSWCNAQMNPCRAEEDEKNVCQSKSDDNVCVHTGPNEFECVCNKFWEGEICQKDVDECRKCDVGDGTGCPCKNGATCRNVEQINDNPLGFQCFCELGTAGLFCERINDPCARKPCLTKKEFGGAPESDACKMLTKEEIEISDPTTLSGYKCKCNDFWGGLDCEMRMGTCADDPCKRRGLCIDDPNYPNFYQCLCNPGYENDEEKLNQGSNGEFCTKIKDLCESNPCRNGATCLMIGPSDRKCVCLPGWVGPNCESLLNPCYSPGKPKCLNNGKCSPVPKSGTAFTCDCADTGYKGDICQTNVDECQDAPPCDATGVSKCVDTVGSYKCECKSAYTGKACNEVKSLCTSRPNICEFGGVCSATTTVDSNFECDCASPKVGDNPAFTKSSTDLRCVSPSGFSRLDLSSLNFADNSKGSVYLTRDGGIMDNPFYKLDYGAFHVESTEEILEKHEASANKIAWMMLYFKVTGPTAANLMTVWDTESKATVMEIVPDAEGRNFVLKLPTTTPAIEIPLPDHSLKSWNNILVTTDASDTSIAVYLNTALVAKKTYTAFASFGDKERIVFGSAVTEADGTLKGSYFNGGIADLFFGSFDKASFEDSMKELQRLHAPGCKNILDLAFDSMDPYRDDGCMRFDPVAEVQEAATSWVNSNGNDYPMVSFKPLMKPVDAMAKYSKSVTDAFISVPNFPALFKASIVAKYSMMFRFRPTYDAVDEGEDAFAFSPEEGGSGDDKVFQVGTKWTSDQFQFNLMLKTDAETKTMTSVLADVGENSPFCYDCVWNVVVEWDATAVKGKSADNIKIFNNFRGAIQKTTYTIQGKMDAAKVSSLQMGVNQNHQIGRTRFWVGGIFSEDERNNFLQKGEDKRPPPTPGPNNAAPTKSPLK